MLLIRPMLAMARFKGYFLFLGGGNPPHPPTPFTRWAIYLSSVRQNQNKTINANKQINAYNSYHTELKYTYLAQFCISFANFNKTGREKKKRIKLMGSLKKARRSGEGY